MVRLKWECKGTPTITKHEYPSNCAKMSRSGRRNRQQCNIVLIIKVKKTKERSVMEAAVNIGKIDLFAPLAFGQSSHRSGGTTPPPQPTSVMQEELQ